MHMCIGNARVKETSALLTKFNLESDEKFRWVLVNSNLFNYLFVLSLWYGFQKYACILKQRQWFLRLFLFPVNLYPCGTFSKNTHTTTFLTFSVNYWGRLLASSQTKQKRWYAEVRDDFSWTVFFPNSSVLYSM